MNRNAPVDITDFEPIPENEILIDKVQALTTSMDERYARGEEISAEDVKELAALHGPYSQIGMPYHAQSKAYRKQMQEAGILEESLS